MSFFRDALTWLAVLVIAALTAALAVPYFVDWSGRRALVESLLSQALGARVDVRGDIVVRLLPTPILDLHGVSLRGEAPGDPRLVARRLRLEMEPAPLIRGAVRFVEASLEAPRLTLSMTQSGALLLPSLPARAPDEVAFERIEVVDGVIEIERPGAPALLLEGVRMNAEAAGLRGPFRASGALRAFGETRAVRIVTGAFEDGRIRVKASAESAGALAQADVDGLLFVESGELGARRLRLEGPAAFSGRLEIDGATIPWRIAGQGGFEPGLARLEPMEARIGGEERPAVLTGLAIYDEGRGAPLMRLAAPQLDLDRLLSPDPRAPDAARAATLFARLISETLATPGGGSAPFDVEVETPAVQIGGETITDARMRLTAPEGLLALSANLPGRARVTLDGRVETGAAARFAGQAAVSLRDGARLAEWAARFDAQAGEWLRASPFASLDAQGRIEASRAALAARDLVVRADRSTFNGVAAYTRALPGARARLFADLTAPSLDLETLPDLTGLARASADMDLNLALDARAVRLARVGAGVVDAGRIELKFMREGQAMRLERLALDDLGGANLRASGRLDETGGLIEGSLDAQRLGELAALLRRIAPGPFADALADRATALSPARLNALAEASMREGALELRNVRIDGSARGTRIAGFLRPTGERVDGEIELLSADAPMLLRQFGFDAAPTPGLRARVLARANGSRADGYSVSLNGDVAGSQISFDGALAQEDARFAARGTARVRASDSAPLLRALALPAPAFGQSAPLDAQARLVWRDGAVEIADLSGGAMGAAFSGALRLGASGAGAGEGERRMLTGALTLDTLSLATLSGFALGAPRAPRPGAAWSEQAFAPPQPAPFAARLSLRAQTLDLRPGVVTQDARMTFALAPGVATFEDVALRVGEAGFGGRLVLRRDGADASLSGRIEMDAPLAGRFDAQGRLVGALDLAASGRSEAALIGNLAGGGSLRLVDGRIMRLDAGALDRVVALAEADAISADDRAVAAALAREFERASLSLAPTQLDAVIASGALRIQPARAQVEGAGVEATIAGLYDARAHVGESVIELQSRTQPKGWSGASPRVRLAWSGPADKSARTIDASALSSALASRALARESARIATLEADIRERAAFNRRLKAQEWLRQRAAEIDAFHREQARIAEEAARREDESRKAEADARRRAQQQQQQQQQQQEEERRRQDALRLRREQEAREAQPRPAPPPPQAPRAPSDPLGDFLQRQFGVGGQAPRSATPN